jgi:uroporphyrinogen-III synthase
MPRSPGQRLTGCHVVSLRPAGEHAALRRAAAREGAGLIALSPWRIASRSDADTRTALHAALRASRVVFTSPNAVRSAHALAPLAAAPGQRWFGVGASTARALRDAGVPHAVAPARMDSEGLLALDDLHDIAAADVGLVTAPGGRGLIAQALQARGARVRRADVYERVPVPVRAAALARLDAAADPLWLALTSAEALQRIQAALPAPAWQRLLHARTAAASERLAQRARAAGFAEVLVAAGPHPRTLVEAMAQAQGASLR